MTAPRAGGGESDGGAHGEALNARRGTDAARGPDGDAPRADGPRPGRRSSSYYYWRCRTEADGPGGEGSHGPRGPSHADLRVPPNDGGCRHRR